MRICEFDERVEETCSCCNAAIWRFFSSTFRCQYAISSYRRRQCHKHRQKRKKTASVSAMNINSLRKERNSGQNGRECPPREKMECY
eukprot:1644435-Amphidinium_carterae.1